MVAIIVMTTDPAVGVMGHKEARTQEETRLRVYTRWSSIPDEGSC